MKGNNTPDKDYTVLLYYKYVPIKDLEAFRAEQFQFMQKAGIKGRIIIASEGINGTLEGTNEAVTSYIQYMKADSRFADVDWKIGEGTGNAFPKLKVKVRKEIVSTHLNERDIDPNQITGTHITPENLHELIHSDEEFYIIDMRNDYEQILGKFKGSLDSGMKNFRDLPDIAKSFKALKDKKVVTVCTGGIRCEKASGYLKQSGFKDVSQLNGGIHRYIEKFGGDGWLGSLYVFDGRVVMKPEKNHIPIGRCFKCSAVTEEYCDCAHATCGKHFLCCDDCISADGLPYCNKICEEETISIRQ